MEKETTKTSQPLDPGQIASAYYEKFKGNEIYQVGLNQQNGEIAKFQYTQAGKKINTVSDIKQQSSEMFASLVNYTKSSELKEKQESNKGKKFVIGDIHGNYFALARFYLDTGYATIDKKNPIVFVNTETHVIYNTLEEAIEKTKNINKFTISLNLEPNPDFDGKIVKTGDLVDEGLYTEEILALEGLMNKKIRELPIDSQTKINNRRINIMGNHEKFLAARLKSVRNLMSARSVFLKDKDNESLYEGVFPTQSDNILNQLKNGEMKVMHVDKDEKHVFIHEGLGKDYFMGLFKALTDVNSRPSIRIRNPDLSGYEDKEFPFGSNLTERYGLDKNKIKELSEKIEKSEKLSIWDLDNIAKIINTLHQKLAENIINFNEKKARNNAYGTDGKDEDKADELLMKYNIYNGMGYITNDAQININDDITLNVGHNNSVLEQLYLSPKDGEPTADGSRIEKGKNFVIKILGENNRLSPEGEERFKNLNMYDSYPNHNGDFIMAELNKDGSIITSRDTIENFKKNYLKLEEKSLSETHNSANKEIDKEEEIPDITDRKSYDYSFRIKDGKKTGGAPFGAESDLSKDEQERLFSGKNVYISTGKEKIIPPTQSTTKTESPIAPQTPSSSTPQQPQEVLSEEEIVYKTNNKLQDIVKKIFLEANRKRGHVDGKATYRELSSYESERTKEEIELLKSEIVSLIEASNDKESILRDLGKKYSFHSKAQLEETFNVAEEISKRIKENEEKIASTTNPNRTPLDLPKDVTNHPKEDKTKEGTAKTTTTKPPVAPPTGSTPQTPSTSTPQQPQETSVKPTAKTTTTESPTSSTPQQPQEEKLVSIRITNSVIMSNQKYLEETIDTINEISSSILKIEDEYALDGDKYEENIEENEEYQKLNEEYLKKQNEI
ncbi:MAG: hypothetical protein LBC92_01330, partial [Rickettsiales bacterium]|nr:hypothetical protein [Rickettsiales bacterium]